jgi:hypothetical protein
MRLLHGKEPLATLLGPLMSLIVLPYLGTDAASQELSAGGGFGSAIPPLPSSDAGIDPLQGLRMRLTFRTVLVLGSISAAPGASNREVAKLGGITDQGQVSKLLARLAKLELIENRGLGHKYGAANAWHLTERGAQLERATRHR